MRNILTTKGLMICHGYSIPQRFFDTEYKGEEVTITDWVQDEIDYGKLPLVNGRPTIDEELKKNYEISISEDI